MSETRMQKEKPILFSGPMVRALREKRKTQTRRLMKSAKCKDSGVELAPCEVAGEVNECDYRLAPFVPGNVLWVRETWCPTTHGSYEPWPRDKKAPLRNTDAFIQYRADYKGGDADYDRFWRPSIFMPRWASRITLRVTAVRAERLQDISEADARAEGITDGGCLNCGNPEPCGCPNAKPSAADSFFHLWETINGRDSLIANPFVWVYTFEEVPHA